MDLRALVTIEITYSIDNEEEIYSKLSNNTNVIIMFKDTMIEIKDYVVISQTKDFYTLETNDRVGKIKLMASNLITKVGGIEND
jgi:hypothetical protein